MGCAAVDSSTSHRARGPQFDQCLLPSHWKKGRGHQANRARRHSESRSAPRSTRHDQTLAVKDNSVPASFFFRAAGFVNIHLSCPLTHDPKKNKSKFPSGNPAAGFALLGSESLIASPVGETD